MLATVEDLVPGRSVGPVYARFVVSPAMTALRRIEVFDPPTLAALRETPANLVHVSCPRWKAGRYEHELAHHVLPACDRFPALRSLAIHIDGLHPVMSSKLFARLTSLTVAGRFSPGLALWPRLPRTMSLTVASSAMLDDCAKIRVGWPSELQLRRDGDRVIARVSGDWLLFELVARFAMLPADLSRIELDGGVEQGAGDRMRLLRAPRDSQMMSGELDRCGVLDELHTVAPLFEACRRRGIDLVIVPGGSQDWICCWTAKMIL
jgi:hypothetical protein